ncbi:MAG: membrane protein insertion efficiency factor YidD [Myxococcota bacterium]|nr:membrane protein insertion efficiency factor YidD [Myxococcota bacterium]
MSRVRVEAAGGVRTPGLRRGVRRLAEAVLVFLVHAYRVGLAPHLMGTCRYAPSCSAYALEAIRVHGPWHGARIAARRIARCHPFHPGGFDPVPAVVPMARGGDVGPCRRSRGDRGAADGP